MTLRIESFNCGILVNRHGRRIRFGNRLPEGQPEIPAVVFRSAVGIDHGPEEKHHSAEKQNQDDPELFPPDRQDISAERQKRNHARLAEFRRETESGGFVGKIPGDSPDTGDDIGRHDLKQNRADSRQKKQQAEKTQNPAEIPAVPADDNPVVEPDQRRRQRGEKQDVASLAERIQAEKEKKNVRKHPEIFGKQRGLVNCHQGHAERRIQEKRPGQQPQRGIKKGVENMSEIFQKTVSSGRDDLQIAVPSRNQPEKNEEHDHGVDEHVWTSVPNEITIIGNLASMLSAVDPENAETYRSNAEKYIEKLKELDERIRKTVASSRLDTIIFASRFPLLYFAREYGLEYYAAFPGCAEETEPSARTIAFLIGKARELGVRDVLNIELSSSLIARTIAEEAGCGVLVFNSMHNITRGDFAQGETYITLMERNIEVLEEVLS